MVGGVCLLVVACGGGGPSLESWVEEADAVCADRASELEEFPVATLDDLTTNGEERSEVLDGTVEDLEQLEAPDGEDGEAPGAVIDGVSVLVDLNEARVEAVGDGDDELAVVSTEIEYFDDTEDGVEAAEDIDMDECQELLETPRSDIEASAARIDLLGDLGQVRVGDCVRTPDDGSSTEVVECDSEDADGEVVRALLTGEPECPPEADTTRTVRIQGDDAEVELGLCVTSFGPDPEEVDNVWAVGSCVHLTPTGDNNYDSEELPCDDPEATHTVTDAVRQNRDCPDGDVRIDKTPQEAARSGPGDWCLTPE